MQARACCRRAPRRTRAGQPPLARPLAAWLLAATAVVLGRPRPAEAGAQGNPPDATAFIQENVGLTSGRRTLDELRARVAPQTEKSRAVPNLHVPGQVDRVITLTRAGLEVEAYEPAGGAVLILRITATGRGHLLPAGLRIGKSRLRDVSRALGEDAETTTGPGGAPARRYQTQEGNASALIWFDAKARLAGVEWRFQGD